MGEVLHYSHDALVHHPRRSTPLEIARKVQRSAGDRIAMRKKQIGAFSAGMIMDLVQWSFIDPRSFVAIAVYTRRKHGQRMNALKFGVRMSLAATREKLRVLFGGDAYRG